MASYRSFLLGSMYVHTYVHMLAYFPLLVNLVIRLLIRPNPTTTSMISFLNLSCVCLYM